MAWDRYITKCPVWPLPIAIRAELEEYLDGSGITFFDDTSEHETGATFIVTIPGHPSSQILRDPITAKPVDPHAYMGKGERATRGFEVLLHCPGFIAVVTRQMDELTNNIATGFAKRLARKFSGELDMGG